MDLHPHWNTTGDDVKKSSVSVPIDTDDNELLSEIPHHHHSTSRRPAALTGIAIAIALGLTYSNDWDMLSDIQLPNVATIIGQLTSTNATGPVIQELQITDSGLSPKSVIAKQGESIFFVNGSGIPQIIEFEARFTGEGNPSLTSAAIFPGSRESVTIPLTTIPGLYSFFSSTDPDIKGQILVQPAAASNSSQGTGINTDGVPLPGGNFDYTIPGGSTSSGPTGPVVINAGNTSSSAVDPADNIPLNPYTAGSNTQHPFDAEGNPIPELFNEDGTLKPSATNDPLHGGAPLDTQKPQTAQTGPNNITSIILAIMFVGSLGWMFGHGTRKAYTLQ
jgi:hypothetical protein